MRNKPRLVLVNNYRDKEKGEKALRNLSNCTGETVRMVEHGTRNLDAALGHLEPTLVFLSGSEYLLSKPGTKEGFREEMELVKNPPFPILGICFGHQLIGTAYGVGMSDLGQMVRRFEPVNVVDHHPVFSSLPSVITVAESHRQVLNRVPEGFHLLANSATSRVEAICHRTLPLYGLQFHPERADDAHPHGQALLRNFLRIGEAP